MWSAITDKIFEGLNERQREAVNYLEGPLLVMAGAGSGKTRVLTCRIANLLAHGVRPWNILAITFTNKAANEMKSRAASMIGEPARNVLLSTFHSFCARILRADVENVGFRSRSFGIYDAADSRALIKNIIKEFGLDEKRFSPPTIHGRISSAKNLFCDANQFADAINGSDEKSRFDQQVAEIYKEYDKRLAENNAFDFDDLLLYAVRMLEQSDEILDKYQRRFQYILIDEYQDTNFVQYRLTKLLAAAHHNLCVVGDADQSIYRFRGADIRNILSFERDYPEAKVVLLEENYRSTKMILDAANAVIENNENRKPKKLWTRNPIGDRLTFFEAANDRLEAQQIVNEIKILHQQQFAYKDIALLYRTNAQSRALEEAFMHAGIPYVIIGGLKFYERKEIKDIVAYLRLIVNLQDSVSLMRIINAPRRGIGQTTIAKLNQFALNAELPLFDIISDVELLIRTNVPPKAKQSIYQFAVFIHDCIERQTEFSLPEFVMHVLEESGYMNELRENQSDENAARLENLSEFVNVAKEFATGNPNAELDDFLNHIALISDLDNLKEENDRVSLMTVHSAKGLEFPVVFVTGLEEGLFPHSSALLAKDKNNDDEALEEERRAAYVALTRARKKLYLTCAMMRSTFGNERMSERSRFIDEIPLELISSARRSRPTRPRLAQTSYMSPPISPPSPKIIQFQSKKFVPDVGVDWSAGDRARHGKWGDGTVLAVKGADSNAQLTIQFDDPNVGKKNLILQYAPIKKI